MRALFASLILLPMFASVSTSQEKEQSDQQKLLGEWTVVGLKAARGQISGDEVKKIKLAFTKEHITVTPWFSVTIEQEGVLFGPRGERCVSLVFQATGQKARYQLNGDAKPRQFNFVDDEGKVTGRLGIYEIEGDNLKLFLDVQRPKNFTSEGELPSLFFEAKRVNDKKK